MNEILSPAGNMDMLKCAIKAGCDAVYISGKNYGARKFALNFSDEELKEAILYSHVRGVKVYVTVNTIIFQSELEEAVNYVKYLYEIGADAIIVQDIGLIKIISEIYPEIEMHASTQLFIYNDYQAKLLKELNIKRIVFPREMSLEEVDSFDKSFEKEIFIHGALCSSYSGQCFLSFHVLNRSGNRGECAGLCRLLYKDNDQSKYFLSMKDLCSIPFFDKIKSKKFASLKIEGRMKSKEYVYLVTKIYKDLLNEKFEKEDLKKLNIIFNRGYTEGYLNNDNDLFNLDASNHIGIVCGKVIDIDKKFIKIKLYEDFYQEDSIRINNQGKVINFLYDNKKLLTNFVREESICYIKNDINCKIGDEVRKTKSNYLEKEISRIPEKKSALKFKIKLEENKRIYVNIQCLDKNIDVYGDVVEKANNYPVSKDDIIRIFNKIKDTPFYISDFDVLMEENLYINLKSLNELKRKCIKELIDAFNINRKLERCFDLSFRNHSKNDQVFYEVFVPNEKIFLLVKDYNIDKFITDDFDLYQKYKGKFNFYYKVERLDINRNFENENLLITDFSMAEKYKNNNLINDYFLNVSNSSFIDYLNSKGINNPLVSIELPIKEIKEIFKYSSPTVLVYSPVEVMLIKKSVFENEGNIFDRNNSSYNIKLDKNNCTHIINQNKFELNDKDFMELLNSGMRNIRINLSLDDEYNIYNIFKKFKISK